MLQEDTGKGLLDEMRQKTLQAYNTSQVSRVAVEIDYIDARIEDLKREAESNTVSEALSVNFAILKACRERHVRILRAYHFHRMRLICENYFEKNSIKGLLSAAETEMERDSVEMLGEYLEKYRHLDLKNREPPLDFYVQIVTIENCGLVMNGDNFIDLKKGRLYFLKKADVAHLISKKLVRLI